MTAAEAVWYALVHLHRRHPQQDAFDKQDITRTAVALGFWELQPQTLFQHLSQWVNAQSSSESARGAFVTGIGRGGPYRLVRTGDPIAKHRRSLPTHPDPGTDAERVEAVRWYKQEYMSRRTRPPRPPRAIAIEADTAEALVRYAEAHGMDSSTTATMLIKEALMKKIRDDPIFDIIGIAEGDENGSVDHDEAIYK